MNKNFLVSDSTDLSFVTNISHAINATYIKDFITRFGNQEIKFCSNHLFSADKLFILVNRDSYFQNIFEMCFFASFIQKNYQVEKIILILPYIPYCRQDKGYIESPLQIFNDFLVKSGIKGIITFDLHCINNFIFPKNSKLLHISHDQIFIKNIKQLLLGNDLLIAPDAGAKERAENLGKILNIETAILSKTRKQKCDITYQGDTSIFQDRNCIIVDDILDSGETLCSATDFLLSYRAKQVSACITHSILSKNANLLIEQCLISNIITTDSFKHSNLSDKFIVTPLAYALKGIII